MFIDTTVAKTMRVLTTIVAFAALLWIAYRLRSVITWLGIGVFLAIIINPAVSKLTHYMPGKKRGFSVAAVILLGLVLFGVLVSIFVPPIVQQGSALIRNWPEITDTLTENIQNSNEPPYKFLREHGAIEHVQQNKDELKNSISDFFGASLQKLWSLLGSIGAMFTIAAMMVYVSINGPQYSKTVMKHIPRRHRRDFEQLMGRMYATVTGYVNGNLLTSTIAGLACGLVATILGLPYPALLALIVGLTDLIPMIGATLGATIVVIIALFTTSTPIAIFMAIFFLIYQQVENYVLVPRVMSRTVEMSSFGVFLAALSGGILAGFVGALVAIPIGACIQILVSYGLQKKGW